MNTTATLYPISFTDNRPELTDGLGTRSDKELSRLYALGYLVKEGISEDIRQQIVEAAQQPHIKEFCEHDTERFATPEQARQWLARGRAVLTIESDDRLVGYGWVGPKLSSESGVEADATMSIRLTQAGLGKGLAEPFARILTDYALHRFSAQGVWIEAWRANERAVHVYEKIGYRIVAESAGVRHGVADKRLIMVCDKAEGPDVASRQEEVPQTSEGPGVDLEQNESIFRPRLFVDQKLTAFVNRYRIIEANGDQRGGIKAFAQQKRLALKEKVQFYTDETKRQPVFSFRAEKVLDIHGRFFVEDENGQTVGLFKKDFEKSLVNSTWHLLNADGAVKLIVRESNDTLAALRRFLSFVPIVGELGDIVMMFFKYHFVLIDAATGQEVGMYTKTTLWRDHYRLDTNDAVWERNDWRVLAALCVALDALQSR